MHCLEQYYSGDEHWLIFSKLYRKYGVCEEVVNLSKKFNSDIILASVIYGKIGENYYLEWIEKKIPALDYLSPLDCSGRRDLTNRLKEMLMRMP